jgi:hypothetical protein
MKLLSGILFCLKKNRRKSKKFKRLNTKSNLSVILSTYVLFLRDKSFFLLVGLLTKRTLLRRAGGEWLCVPVCSKISAPEGLQIHFVEIIPLYEETIFTKQSPDEP